MNVLKQGLSLALLGAGLAAFPALQAAAAPAPAAAGTSLVDQMRSAAQGTVRTSGEASTGKVGFVRASLGGDLLPSVSGTPSAASAAAKASTYLDRYSAAFGAAKGQLQQSSVVAAKGLGWTVTYTQDYRGIPVFGALVRAHVDQDGDLTSVNGFAAPGIDLGTSARQSTSAAASRAIAFVKSSPGTAANGASATIGTLKATSNDLVVYRTGAIKGDEGTNVLAYVVEVSDGGAVRDKVFVDATSGKVLNRYSMVDNALDRELQEATGPAASPTLTTVWQEGNPFPGALNQDQQNLVVSSGESYWFFKNTFDRDSYDGNGAKRITVNNDPRIACPNANWNGQTTNYCDGVTSDDVVAHEWGHAYTEFTWGGIYQWQPGALNEAYSDIWGETLDLTNNREDEGEGDITSKRPVGLCSTHSPANPLLSINSPSSIAKDCLTGGASYGPQLDGEGLTGDVVAATDADEDGAAATYTTLDGCSDYDNQADVQGKIALVDRGGCAFTEKTIKAQEMGATAVIIGNRDDSTISPSGDEPTVTIPTVTIGLTDRELIRTALAVPSTVNVTMKDASGDRYDSYRWLIGEKAEAFGGAIRDMWNPTCYGDPGKVSDVEYKCSTDDQGGVHGNSGVPNHGYALLVDGGTYNGTAVKGIGLDKAANIYYRAMSAYQTPVSDFPDHADSLEASCTDLTGKAIKQISVLPNDSNTSQQRITSADCAQVAAMAKAVELRTPAVQCDFQPQLDPNSPASACGEATSTKSAFSEDFEKGLGNWTLGADSVYGGPTRDWKPTTDLPSGNKPAGDLTAAYGPAPDLGTCTGDAADFSSVNTMTSPDIVVGDDGDLGARLSFDHNIQTELGFDGGNLQLSVNGGAFGAIPAAAYTFNGPSTLATEAAGNTDPLAGQPGFTGTDGGQIVSDWGTSIVDLEAAGVTPGDTVQLRFAIGRDGCGGVNGWWVDNVKVSTCVAKETATVTAAHAPQPVAYGTGHKVNVTVAGGTAVPTGTVTVKEGSTTRGTGTLSAGKASVSLPTTLSAGRHTLTVSYAGDDTHAAATTTVTATVTKASSKTTATAPTPVKQGKAFNATTRVTASGTTPTGKVTVFSGSTKVGTGTLSKGVVKIRITRNLGTGIKTLKATYAGSANVSPSQDTFKVRFTK